MKVRIFLLPGVHAISIERRVVVRVEPRASMRPVLPATTMSHLPEPNADDDGTPECCVIISVALAFCLCCPLGVLAAFRLVHLRLFDYIDVKISLISHATFAFPYRNQYNIRKPYRNQYNIRKLRIISSNGQHVSIYINVLC